MEIQPDNDLRYLKVLSLTYRIGTPLNDLAATGNVSNCEDVNPGKMAPLD